MSGSTYATYVGGDEIAVGREMWVLVIRGLDGDPGAREEGRHLLIAAAPLGWDDELDDDGGAAWQPARPEMAPAMGERPEGEER
ncbi:hypothetical protein [Actinomadura sp. 6N118]|uniref:hypothetical protein n=1 Tax=Actinomadura sp. 6N118 TaxID=3375151 RepID=UPI0037A82983